MSLRMWYQASNTVTNHLLGDGNEPDKAVMSEWWAGSIREDYMTLDGQHGCGMGLST